MKNTLIAVAALAACASASAETISLKSPDGRNEITLATEPALTVAVARDGKPVLGPAPISMTFDGKGVIGGAGAKVMGTRNVPHRATIPTPIYKKACVQDDGAETVVSFTGDWQIHLHARNDGVAYRFATAWKDPQVKVKDEQAPLVFPSTDLVAYAGLAGGHECSWESIYEKTTVGALKDKKASSTSRCSCSTRRARASA